MRVLTKPSTMGRGYEAESRDIPDVIYKLGKIEYKAYALIEEACDNYCKYPEKTAAADEPDAIDEICEKCPINRLHDMIYKKGAGK